MDVIIKDMDMPKNCWGCPMIQVMVGKRYCGKTLSDIKDSTIKLPDCPLIEIPTPHGRLIDADATIARLKYLYCENCGNNCERCPWGAFIKYIEARPTIVDKS